MTHERLIDVQNAAFVELEALQKNLKKLSSDKKGREQVDKSEKNRHGHSSEAIRKPQQQEKPSH